MRLVLLLLLLLAACSDKTDLRRFASATDVEANPSELTLRLSIGSVPSTPSRARITDLSDHGQGEMVRAWRGFARSSSDLDRLFDPPAGNVPREGQAILDRATRQITANVLHPPRSRHPGDRIDSFRVSIRPLNFTLDNYRNAEGQITIIERAQVQRTSSRDTGQSIGTDAPAGVPISAKLTAGQRQELQTSSKITETNGILAAVLPHCLIFDRHGSAYYDIDGNTSVEATLNTEQVAPRREECDIAPRDGIPVVSPDLVQYWVVDAPLTWDGNRISVKPSGRPGSVQTYPLKPLAALVRFDFTLRRVLGSGRDLPEGAQAAEYRHGLDLSCRELQPLGNGLYKVMVSGFSTLNVVGEGAEPMALVFTDYARASRFAAWLSRARPNHLGALRFEAYPPGTAVAQPVATAGPSPCAGFEGKLAEEREAEVRRASYAR